VAESLADLIVNRGLAPAEVVERAQARQQEVGGALDTALLELVSMDEERLLQCLSAASELPPAPPTAYTDDDPRPRRVFPSKVAERHGLAPFALEGRELSLVSSYPVDVALLEEISFMLSLHLKPHVGPEWRVRELIQRLYGSPVPERLQRIAQRTQGAAALTTRPAPAPARAPDPAPMAPPPSEEGLDLEMPPDPPAPAAFSSEGANQEPLAAALAQVLEESEAAELLKQAAPPDPSPRSDARRSTPPRWTLEQARQALAATDDRDEVVLVGLRYARDFFEYAALLAVTRDSVAGHDALGQSEEVFAACRRLSMPVGQSGILRTILETCGPHLGPIPAEPGNEALVSGLERPWPRTAFLYPVMLRDRPVCILYADNGGAPVSPRRLGDLLLLAGGLGAAFERSIRAQKKARDPASAAEAAPKPPAAPARSTVPEPPASAPAASPAPADVAPTDITVDVELSSDEPAAETAATPAAPAPAEAPASPSVAPLAPPEPLVQEQIRGAPRFDPVTALNRLLASQPRSGERGSVVAELVEHGAEAAPLLVAQLPGPLETKSMDDWLPVFDLGPIFAALAAIGHAATPSLLAVMVEPEPERRRAATLLLGYTGDPSAQLALADRVFDSHSRVASAARRALGTLRRRPDLRPILEKLRRALLSEIPERSSAAALALGELRDSGAIPLLIQVLECPSPDRVAAAAHALSVITLERHGTSARRWLSWWKENRGRPRAQWLLDALRHADRSVRATADSELRYAGAPPIPYSPDAPADERNVAVEAWVNLWERSGFVV
jgi:hypothetical protein